MPAKMKSKRQIGFLLSNKVSPLSAAQKDKLKRELHTGAVRVKKPKKRTVPRPGPGGYY